MPNIKSAIKRVSVIEKKTERNNMIKTGYKTVVKKFENAVEANDVKLATELFSEATKKIDQACTKHVITKNAASRKKSNLAKKLNSIATSKPKKATKTAKAEKVEKDENVEKEEVKEEKPKAEKKTTAKKTTTTKKTAAKKTTTKKETTK